MLALLLGLLLTVPLALLLLWTWRGPAGETFQEVSPLLSEAEVQPLHSWWQRCERREDCEPPLGCLPTLARTEGVCSDSWCLTDLQCEQEGMVCRTLRTLGDGPLVRTCVWPGQRREGEACSERWGTPRSACAGGLLCNEGWCGRRCQPEDPSSCPEGFSCREGIDGPSCVPTCDGRACPEGQECTHLGADISVCATVHGEDCLHQPCPEGEVCLLGDPLHAQAGLALWRRCARRCGKGQHPCPEGSPCVEGTCRHRCDPEAPVTCTPHERCYLPPRSTGPGVCLPRYR